MAKLIRLTFLLSIATLLQCSYCIREKRDLTELIIPNINVANATFEPILDVIYGQERHKDEATLGRQLQGMDTAKPIRDISNKISERDQNTSELALLLEDLKKMFKHLNNIDSAFQQYESYRNSNKSINDAGLHRFAKDSSKAYTGPRNEIAEIFSLVTPSSTVSIKGTDFSIVSMMSKHVKGFKILCNQYKSEQLLLRTILESVTAAELKVLLIVEYSIRKLAENKEVDYENEMDLLKDTFQGRFKTLVTVFQSYMSKSPLEVWRCDPESFVERESYFKMNVFQKYIVRASDLQEMYNTCPKSCSRRQKAKQLKCRPYSWYDSGLQYKEYYDSYGRVCSLTPICAGILYDCNYKFTRDRQVWACLADKNSSRRYEFIEEGYNGYLYGQKTSCDQGYSFDMVTTVSRSAVSVPEPCNEVCICTCDDSPSKNSDQKVNLRAATADKDHVITGLRWLKQDHTLHLQIQQGKILKKGDVDASTVHWKDIKKPRYREEVAIMNFHDLRGFHLQDAFVAKGHVLAGVKLEVVQHKIKYSRIFTLRLLPLAYEYDTGTLNYTKPFYEDPDGSVAEGVWDKPIAPEQVSYDNELYFNADKLPTDAKEPSVPLDSSKKMVRLTTSDFDSDAGQTTIPFFDMQENAIVPPAPLSGVGIYLKKSNNYAGYLALKLFTFDSSSHIVKKIHI